LRKGINKRRKKEKKLVRKGSRDEGGDREEEKAKLEETFVLKSSPFSQSSSST
jgi:hypothetical protein